MEYAPINLPRPGEPRAGYGTPFQHHARPVRLLGDRVRLQAAADGLTGRGEGRAARRSPARSAEPQLAYGTDEDNFLGIDPESLHFDLGNDVVGFAKKRIAIARDLLKRQETRQLRPDQDYSVLRRSVSYAMRDVGRAAGVLARQIGGVRTLRDYPGSGRDPLQPVPVGRAARGARRACRRPARRPTASRVSPALQRKLAHRLQERGDALRGGDGRGRDRLLAGRSRCSACSARCSAS